MGGGGDHRLLYFLVRHLRPATVVETGEAAGFSSAAVPRAMRCDRRGHLWSSDFPLFRHDHPEQGIGILVSTKTAADGRLLTKGHRANLLAILPECSPVDIFHYDSDKSRAGRSFAIDLIANHMVPDGVMVIDDMQNNMHFRDWTGAHGHDLHVFLFGGKYLSLVPLGQALKRQPSSGSRTPAE